MSNPARWSAAATTPESPPSRPGPPSSTPADGRMRLDLAALFVPRRTQPPPARPTVDVPDLARLFEAYLPPHVTVVRAEATAAVQRFRAAEPADVVERAAAQALELAELPVPDAQLDQILVIDLGSGFWPPREGQDVRDWLRDVSHLLAADEPRSGS